MSEIKRVVRIEGHYGNEFAFNDAGDAVVFFTLLERAIAVDRSYLNGETFTHELDRSPKPLMATETVLTGEEWQAKLIDEANDKEG